MANIFVLHNGDDVREKYSSSELYYSSEVVPRIGEQIFSYNAEGTYGLYTVKNVIHCPHPGIGEPSTVKIIIE